MAGAILAAGRGERLGGRPKAALEIADVSVLERLAGALRGVGVETLSAVIGPYAATLLPIAARAGTQALRHARPAPTLKDSQRLALEHHLALHPGSDLMLVLGDLALLDAPALLPLLHAWLRRPARIDAMMPMVEGVRGHPVLLSSRAVHDILQATPWPGIRDWLSAHPGSVRAIAMPGRAYVTDLDTPADLARLRALLAPLPVEWPAAWEWET